MSFWHKNLRNKKKFLCQAGVIGKKVDVQVIKKLADIEQEEFDRLLEKTMNFTDIFIKGLKTK